MKSTILSAIAALALAGPVAAETIEVEMLTRTDDGRNMVFSPELIEVEVGDIVRFVPTDKSHNAQSVDGAIPEGQEPFKGRMNQAVEYEVTEPGITAVICLPHQTLGMAAVIVAGGDLSNADEVLDAQIRGQSEGKVAELIEEARAGS